MKRQVLRAYKQGKLNFGFSPYSENRLCFLWKDSIDEEGGGTRSTQYLVGQGAEQIFKLLYYWENKRPCPNGITLESWSPAPASQTEVQIDKVW